MPLIPQDKSYHNFADQSKVFGIPHFYDVVSNIPFIPIGLWGLTVANRVDWLSFFSGCVAVGAGSSYYHWNPNNDTLVWDRLPMTVCFMSMLSAICQDYGLTFMRLVPCQLFGVASIAIWAKYDELLPYAIVQFGSVLALFCLLALCNSPYKTNSYLWLAFACYGASKLFESYDRPINDLLGGLVSGHTLKHLVSALAFVFVINHLQNEYGVESLSFEGPGVLN